MRGTRIEIGMGLFVSSLPRLTSCSLVLSLLGISLVNPAFAIQGGESAIGAPQVASLLESQYSVRPACSAAHVNSWIVITAAHCVTVFNSESGALKDHDYWVSGPGEDVSLGKTRFRTRVSRIFRTEGYVNVWKPDINDTRTQRDDIAFLVLEKEVFGIRPVPLASTIDVEALKRGRGLIRHFGYGMQAPQQLDGKPYSVELTANPLGSSRYANNPALDSHTITSDETGQKAICGGDSGSPWYAMVDGVEKLVAVTVGGSGCNGGSGTNGALGTVAAQYISLFNNANSLASKLRPSSNLINQQNAKKVYRTCQALRKKFPGGISKSITNAATGAYVSQTGFQLNRSLDRDRDGSVCE